MNNQENRIGDLVQRHKPNFIVLSTLQNLLNGRDYNRQNDMQPIMAGIIELAQSAPLVLVTHSPWDKRQKRAAGSVTQTANFLTALHYEKSIARKTGEPRPRVRGQQGRSVRDRLQFEVGNRWQSSRSGQRQKSRLHRQGLA